MISFHSLISGVFLFIESYSVKVNSVFSHQSLKSLNASRIVISPQALSLNSLISLCFFIIQGTESIKFLNFILSKVISLGISSIVISFLQCSLSKLSPPQSFITGQACLQFSISQSKNLTTTSLFFYLSFSDY